MRKVSGIRLLSAGAGAAVLAGVLTALPATGASGGDAVAAGSARHAAAAKGTARPDAQHVVLAVHGGAGGALKREDAPPGLEKVLRDGLADALRAGQKVLDKGGSSVAAVEAAVRTLEDNEMFNAGKGAVFNEDAGHELDASIMRGSDLAAGAVAGVRNVRNPVSAARLVMEKTRHVLLAGEGADDFAARGGLPTVTQDYYWTEARWQELLMAKGRGAKGKKGGGKDDKLTQGTVGAVAVDHDRNLAAATSSGGLANKMVGRVGDSPVVGAGTYAKNSTVAASATGAGEVFLRGAATATISDLIEFGGKDLPGAAYEVLVKRLPKLGGDGGVIALNAQGVYDAPHSSDGMLDGYLTADGKIHTRIFSDESPPDQ
ncbi:isoaspartyl peptidase/L-asparaginase family protein [Streptomyces sp. NPDC059788]|uniref:isoaspartyl peptidase/L-asparaginase family protein n=1 Tax=Streptomyces sp. NPDC059788 TaxID=3346948 RepID=UPI00365A0E3A